MKILLYQKTDVVESNGGVKKIICSLTSEFTEREYNIIFMTKENKIDKPFFQLSDKIKFINIGAASFIGLRKFIFKLIKSIPLLKIFKYFNNYNWKINILGKNNKKYRKKLGSSARESMKNYDEEIIINMREKLIKETL